MRQLFLHVPLLLAGLLLAASVSAGIRVPAGATLDVGGGRIDLAGSSLESSGTFRLGSGQLLDTLDFRVLDGLADLGAGLLQLSGNFENRGTLASGTSRVELRDGGAAESAILGNSSFATLSLVSTSGKRYRFESGSTQRVTTLLEILGIGVPVQVDVTSAGSVAFVDLLDGGDQNIANVGVSDVHAIGQMLATEQTNQGGNGNDQGWFGDGTVPVPPRPPQPQVVPALSGPGLLVLALLLAAIAWHRHTRSAAA
jgi:hypothetical protein